MQETCAFAPSRHDETEIAAAQDEAHAEAARLADRSDIDRARLPQAHAEREFALRELAFGVIGIRLHVCSVPVAVKRQSVRRASGAGQVKSGSIAATGLAGLLSCRPAAVRASGNRGGS